MADAENKANPGYKGLKIYQQSHALALRVHAMTLTLPAFGKYEEAAQVRRSSKRVSAGIVEGFAQRKYRDEFIRYLYRSLGSSDETREHLEFLHETGSGFDRRDLAEMIAAYETLSRRIARFIMGVERDHATPTFVARSSEIQNPSSSTIHNPKSKIEERP